MIVVDTNVIAYLMIPGDRSSTARELLRTDPDWRAPILWRSEFRNVLATRVRTELLALSEATDLASRAEDLLEGSEHHVASGPVLETATETNLPAYDAEFVTLSRILDIWLVTCDEQILDHASDRAVHMDDFVAHES